MAQTIEKASADLTKIAAEFLERTARHSAPPEAQQTAKRVLLDTLGVCLAAAPRSIGAILINSLASSEQGPTATILGSRRRATVKEAARVNATLANALDFDEGFHIATYVVPTALAVAECHRLGGDILLDGIVMGYEFGAKLTHAIDIGRRAGKGPTGRGFWHVGMVGPLASAATAARLLNLGSDELRRSFGIASCSSGGFRRNMGTMAKALHSGNAARAGLEAVELARHGFTADPSIIEAPLGFLAALCGPDDCEPSELLRLGAPYALETTKNIKRYPACTPGHALIEAALALRQEIGEEWTQIDSIEVDLRPFSLLRNEPDEEDALGFSGAYLIAAALVHGTFTLERISEDGVHDREARELMRRVKHAPKGSSPDLMRLRLKDGRAFEREVAPRPRRLTRDEEIKAKFFACAEPVVGASRAMRVAGFVEGIETRSCLDELLSAVLPD